MTNAKLAADARRLAGDKEPYEPEDDIIAGYIDCGAYQGIMG